MSTKMPTSLSLTLPPVSHHHHHDDDHHHGEDEDGSDEEPDEENDAPSHKHSHVLSFDTHVAPCTSNVPASKAVICLRDYPH